MAILRASEVTEFSDVELQEQLAKLRLELLENNGKISAGGAPENAGRIREIRRAIARIGTEQNKRRNA
ncbi:MAG: 50S ribosomal protein L29 [Methanomicrobiales archaeon]|jgi:large subunit ribosomal protein L29|nr:50S ribosomal protein L29 [Methanomicrobiales archaeon]